MTLLRGRSSDKTHRTASDFRSAKQRREQEPHMSARDDIDELLDQLDLALLENGAQPPDTRLPVADAKSKVFQGSVSFRADSSTEFTLDHVRPRIAWKRKRLARAVLRRDHARASRDNPHEDGFASVAGVKRATSAPLPSAESMAGLFLPREVRDLSDIDSPDQLVAHLEAIAQGIVAQQLQAHLGILAKDPNEPTVLLESLRSLVTFVDMYPWLEPPLIISDPEGQVGLEWHIQEDENPEGLWDHGKGIVSLIFLCSGFVRFVALSMPRREGRECPRIQGESEKKHVLRSLGEFAPMVVHA